MKWSGVTLCVLLFTSWVACQNRVIGLAMPRSGGGMFAVYLGDAQFNVMKDSLVTSLVWSAGELRAGDGFTVADSPASDRWGSLVWEPGARNSYYCIPLWVPFLLIALPTGFLFYSDRKQNRPGLCAVCRYDLRGLPETTMKCPECGAAIAPRRPFANVGGL